MTIDGSLGDHRAVDVSEEKNHPSAQEKSYGFQRLGDVGPLSSQRRSKDDEPIQGVAESLGPPVLQRAALGSLSQLVSFSCNVPVGVRPVFGALTVSMP